MRMQSAAVLRRHRRAAFPLRARLHPVASSRCSAARLLPCSAPAHTHVLHCASLAAKAAKRAEQKAKRAAKEAAKSGKSGGGDDTSDQEAGSAALVKSMSAVSLGRAGSPAEEDNGRSCTGVLASHPQSRDVQIDSFTLLFHGHELLADTRLELNYGRRYGLLGANGCGKSCMLQALAAREVPIPEHIDMYLLDKEIKASDMTALQVCSAAWLPLLHRLVCAALLPCAVLVSAPHTNVCAMTHMHVRCFCAVVPARRL